MSTRTVRRPTKTAKSEEDRKLPEWRRICHYYTHDSLRSVCGTARRRSAQGHGEEYCRSRRHSICIVCSELMKSRNGTK
jgi:hypothetical protein